MKKLLIILLAVIEIACNKDKNTQKPSSSTTSNNNPPVTLTSQEQALVGRWYLDSTVVVSGTITLRTIHTDTTYCKLTLFAEAFVNGSSQSHIKKAYDGLNCTSMPSSVWFIENGMLVVSYRYYTMLTATQTTLRLRENAGNNASRFYYLHR